MRLYSIFLITICFLAVGCSTSQATLELIERSESMAEEHSDSALLYIESVDATTIRGKRDMARYRLAYSEALYYNQIDSDCDSLTRPLFEYYYRSDCHDERARAMYQHALVKMRQGDNPEAIFSLTEAEKSLGYIDNPRLNALVHRTKGDIYSAECLFNNALEEHNKAREYFVIAQLPIHEVYELYSIGVLYGSLREYDKAIEYLLIAESDAIKFDQKLLYHNILVELCYLYVQIGDYARCEDVYNTLDLTEYTEYSLCDYFCIGALINAYKSNFIAAKELLDKARCQVIVDIVHVEYVEFMMLRFMGDYKSALDLYELSIQMQDERTLSALRHNVLNYELDIVESNIDDVTKSNIQLKLLYICTIIGVLIVLVLIILYLRYQKIKHQREVISYINTISELELLGNRENNTDDIIKEIERLYQPNVSELNRLCEIFYESIDSDKCVKSIILEVSQSISKLKNDDDKLSQLERIVNIFKGDIMFKLREQCHTLTDREMKIALYTFAGFSNRAISMLVGSSAETLPKIKYKIRSKIIECCNKKDAEVMIGYLSRRSS